MNALMRLEVFGPVSVPPRRGVILRRHRPAITVSFVPNGGVAVFEGDILLGSTEELENRYKEGLDDTASRRGSGAAGAVAVNRSARIAVTKVDPRWPGNIVPVMIDSSVPGSRRVMDAISVWEMNTHVRFPRRQNEADYVIIRRSSGCASYVGRQGGAQEMELSDDALTGNVMHELGHVVGLWHEHSRDDRDDFISIDWTNIAEHQKHNFDQHVVDGDDIGGYDLDSIMHYPEHAFALDPSRPTIVVHSGRPTGQRSTLSKGDVEAVRGLYPR